MHRLLWGDDDTSETGISNVLGKNSCGWIEVENGRWNSFSSWIRKSSNGNKRREVNRIGIHVAFFKLLDICVAILIVIFIFQ